MIQPWTILRAVLTALFLYFGLRKLTGAPADVAIYEAIGMGQLPRPITGTVETLGALLLWIPALRGLAALALVATMITGTAALVTFTDLPFWHLPLLGVLAAALAWHDRSSLPGVAPR